jgi:RNA polymerase sigma factor (TIGR02999 family)
MERLVPIVYDELNRIAEALFGRESRAVPLQPTALVHEAFLELIGQKRVDFRGRAHFFGLAAALMRRILVDHAREGRAEKRGGGLATTRLPEARAGREASAPQPVDLLALDQALHRLARLDAQQVKVVELRYFGGLTLGETAAALDRSPATVKRDWRLARAFLLRALAAG